MKAAGLAPDLLTHPPVSHPLVDLGALPARPAAGDATASA
jgi:hypothetical protein